MREVVLAEDIERACKDGFFPELRDGSEFDLRDKSLVMLGFLHVCLAFLGGEDNGQIMIIDFLYLVSILVCMH